MMPQVSNRPPGTGRGEQAAWQWHPHSSSSQSTTSARRVVTWEGLRPLGSRSPGGCDPPNSGLDVGPLAHRKKRGSVFLGAITKTLQYRVAESKFIVEVRGREWRSARRFRAQSRAPAFDEPIVRCKFRWNGVGSRDGAVARGSIGYGRLDGYLKAGSGLGYDTGLTCTCREWSTAPPTQPRQ
jgi:hypothetical protein